MFELYKLKRARKKLDENYDDEVAKLKRANATEDSFQFAEVQYEDAVIDAETAIDIFLTDKLLAEAREIDARVPAYNDPDFWVPATRSYRTFLNTTGRDLMNSRIAEIEKRNFERKSRWIQLSMPIWAAVLAGVFSIIGTLLGFFLAFKYKAPH